MTLTSTYDHRVIQGAQSGQFLARIDALLDGADGFYEEVFAALGVPLAALPPRSRRRRPRRRSRAGAAERGAAAGRRHRQRARALAAHARPSRRDARPARLHAPGRPGARSAGDRPDHGPDGADPLEAAAHLRPRRDARRGLPAPSRGLLRHDRLPARAHRLPSAAPLAAGEDRGRRVPPAAARRGAAGPADPPDRGRRARALHAPRLPRPAPVLDRGRRHDGADARRDDPPVRRAAERARS